MVNIRTPIPFVLKNIYKFKQNAYNRPLDTQIFSLQKVLGKKSCNR